jgi:hypothetical protein
VPGGKDPQPVRGCDVRQGSAQVAQLFAGRFQVRMRSGRDFDLRLQHLARHLTTGLPGRLLGRGQEPLRHVADDRLGFGIDQEVFLLDAETEVFFHGQPRVAGLRYLAQGECRVKNAR